MQSLVKKLIVSGAVLGLIALSGAPVEASVPWSLNASGENEHFSWDSGVSENGYFDRAYVTPYKFVFPGTALAVEAANGGWDDIWDQLSFNLHIKPEFVLNRVEYAIHGTYEVDGESSQVTFSGWLELEEFEAQPPRPSARLYHTDMTSTPVEFPLTFGEPRPSEPGGDPQPANGPWAALGEVDLSYSLPGADDDLMVRVYDFLRADAGPTGSAAINGTYSDIQLEIALIPEPATLVLLAMGSIALIRRRH